MAHAKIKTIKGKILTIEVQENSITHVSGIDKFGEFVKIPKKEIDEMIPYTQ